MKAKNLLGLDIGTRRIGVAVANSSIKIAIPLTTIEVNDGDEILQINKIIVNEKINTIVAGLPRNMSGEETAQSVYTKEFLENFKLSVNEIKFQDESLTSVQAENILKSYKKPYTKGDIDMQAAAIILQDYLEENF
ncbi:Holliday junction resolvase RuvX [Candidatus Nanogingivalis gingivitcus]|jgi:RNAse H domain protein, YqgF family|uniref:Putative pre-16S rRNA nuclease n=1 Tax=Candidatus Nanogingivalis gingivitcus TaxID=2171992 RepID=A0ABY0FIZ9_9BACT|nr:Holliday junction resolvase RuvX [Candidatus Nanogingivalis gingivitcus]RYC72913.1 putative pre-16S rRNA nuclease [Candidatus Nanogingivalis gingivitcus]